MSKFYIKETQACWVTWTIPVEAETQDDAFVKYAAGEHDGVIGEPEIGDSIEGYDSIVETSDTVEYGDYGLTHGERDQSGGV